MEAGSRINAKKKASRGEAASTVTPPPAMPQRTITVQVRPNSVRRLKKAYRKGDPENRSDYNPNGEAPKLTHAFYSLRM